MTSSVRRPITLARLATFALALAALLALIHYGRTHGWSLATRAAPERPDATDGDWCAEHGVPESQCVQCNPALRATAAPSTPDWCAEHGLPEAQCTVCHPEIAVRSDAPGDATASAEFRVLEPPAGASGADPRLCVTHLQRVQIASRDVLKRAGIALETVTSQSVADSVRATGELAFDATTLARIGCRAQGVVERVFVVTGDTVDAGDVLALVDAAEVGRAKADLLAALASRAVREGIHARLAASRAQGFRTEAELAAAEEDLRAARVHVIAAEQALANLGLQADVAALSSLEASEQMDVLRFAGIPDALRDELRASTSSANLLPVRAPRAGTVIERAAVVGASAAPDVRLFSIADPSRMWAVLDVRQEDAARVREGQEVTFRVDGSSGPAGRGVVTWIDPAVDDRTRTVRVRAQLDHPDRSLRAHAFGTASIVTRTTQDVPVVPAGAVHWDGCCNIVFVRESDTLFQPRKVVLGARSGDWLEVRNGLLAGEVVATRGSHVLKSALQKSRLGAGCADD